MMLRNIKYSKKIQILFVPVFILMVVGLLLTYRLAVDSLAREHTERLQWTARLTDSGLLSTGQEMVKIANLLQTNRTLKEYLYIVTVLGGGREPLSDLLMPLTRSLSIDDLDLYDQRGRRVLDIDTRPMNDPREDRLPALVGVLPADILYGFLEVGGALKVVAIAPLRDRGGTIGYLTVGKYIDQHYIDMLKSTGGNDIILVRDGTIVVTTVNGVSRSEAYQPAAGKLDLAGSTYSIHERTISGVDGKQLGSMVVALPDGVLLKDIANLKLIMVVLVGCAALLSYVLSRLFIETLVKPLKGIIAFTGKVSRGELKEEFIVKGRDEIADLAVHLNEMRKQLLTDKEIVRHYTSSLERTVDARTTELNQVQRQLLHSQKMDAVGQLAGGMAHDFNNILTAIIGYAHILRRKLPKEDTLSGSVDQIIAAGNRAASLTHGLLAFSRKQKINPAAIDLNDIVLHVEKLLSRLIGEDISLQTNLVESSLTIMADRGQIEQVLMNLAANARDAMPTGGRLVIRTTIVKGEENCLTGVAFDRFSDYAQLSVSDEGMGMDRATKEKIFEPFFTTKDMGKGTGLGLAMVFGIVQQHNGCITVESEPGRGTTMNIYFPLTSAEIAAASTNGATDDPAGGSETILVGEDDAVVRGLVSSGLQEAGYTVIEGADGEDIIRKFEQNRDRIGLVLIDVVMPRKNGKDVLETIRRVRPDLKAVFMSGYTSDIVHSKGIGNYSGVELLSKPFSIHQLLTKVRTVLDNGVTK